MSVEMPSDAAMPSDVELNEVVGSLEESNDALTVDEMLSLHVGEVLSSSFKYFFRSLRSSLVWRRLQEVYPDLPRLSRGMHTSKSRCSLRINNNDGNIEIIPHLLCDKAPGDTNST